ncbi:hypothetical protein ACHAWO_005809 [Cyclotella atomus]|uniref:Uncharacterized protein n=1 Tax=Cyclotella atomus TaxID=382360 RepID=A0ABD3P5H0_9STRA
MLPTSGRMPNIPTETREQRNCSRETRSFRLWFNGSAERSGKMRLVIPRLLLFEGGRCHVSSGTPRPTATAVASGLPSFILGDFSGSWKKYKSWRADVDVGDAIQQLSLLITRTGRTQVCE